jgi:fumarylacetoacetate (FAA) hydrolase
MKLATQRDGSRDGRLLVVRTDGALAIAVPAIARTMQAALDDWSAVAPQLQAVSEALNGTLEGAATPDGAFSLDIATLASPLPRAYAWIDGSAYVNHVVLVRKARNAEPPATLYSDPLVYQGGSDAFLGPRDDIPLQDEAFGCDLEAEICVVTGDVPQAVARADALPHIRLLMLCNDVTLRNLIPTELAKGFGFFQSKPSSAFSPFALTPDELGKYWLGGRVHLPLRSWVNDVRLGDPEAGPEMHFSFADLIAHVARTRPLSAGTVIGSGTVSNSDRARGSSCLAEVRMIEQIDKGEMTTPFLRIGDRVRICMTTPDGRDLFGTIEQTVARLAR